MKKTVDPEYDLMAKKASPPSKKLSNAFKAFIVGGLICLLGQLLFDLYLKIGIKEETVKIAVPVSLIIITAILTGLGIFEKIAKFAGAGTFVPITGFANSVVSPAMEFQSEGRILGTGAKMFNLAGPVITYGCSAAAVFGIIYYCFKLL